MSFPRSTLVLVLLCSGCFFVSEQERQERWDIDQDGVERPADCDDGNPDLQDEQKYFADGDGDGFGDSRNPVVACEAPTGFVSDDRDCDDTDPLSFPEAVERCDGRDNDCDSDVDEGLSLVDWFPDGDEDGFGNDAAAVRACDRPDGHVAVGGDCDDVDPAVNPDATEICNDGIDDDCANGADDDDPNVVSDVWYQDGDGDGAGDDATALETCEDPGTGWVQIGGDCRPVDPSISPLEPEVCNGIDDDCDSTIDVAAVDATRYYTDGDDDGYGDINYPVDACPDLPDTNDTGAMDPCDLAPLGLACNSSDCNDGDPSINPGVSEVCSNGINDDCDGQTDEGDCVP